MAEDDIDKKKKRAIVLGNLGIFGFVVFCVFALGSLLISTYIDVATQQKLLDCTEPTGQCFKRGQARTGEAVDQLITSNNLDEVATRRVVILAAVCADEQEVRDEPDKATRIKLMEKCVNSSLKGDR